MKIITVEKSGLAKELGAWGVSTKYASFFISKCPDSGKSISLPPFAFNDTMHLDDPRQWLAANCAFWCQVYREAKLVIEQIESLSAIRALYYVAAMQGQSVITTSISSWWRNSYELHKLPALNRSMADPSRCFASSFLNQLTH
ncbi:hypothetical protein ACFL9S_17980 [Erwinia sp. AnSW2-5]|uniref:hypothetical protein n=1 Tax=Erwinia sp. AnSW2-5 TaxID=3367692 RepID=UPI00385A97B5